MSYSVGAAHYAGAAAGAHHAGVERGRRGGLPEPKYHASKWAMEGICETLSQEVKPFKIHVTLIEPGGYSTDWETSSAVHSQPNPAYQPMCDAMRQRMAAGGSSMGKPQTTAEAIQ